MAIKKIRAKNFKSLRDIEISLNQLNVLVGPNGAGKTNCVELFKFILDCIRPIGFPHYPFLDWQGYNNIVWKGEENLPVSFGFNLEVEKYDIAYDGVVSGGGGQFRFMEEKFKVDKILECSRYAGKVELIYNDDFITNISSRYNEIFGSVGMPYRKDFQIEDIKHQVIEEFPLNRSILNWQGWGATYSRDMKYAMVNLTPVSMMGKSLNLLCPTIGAPNSPMPGQIRPFMLLSSQDLLPANEIIFLRQTNYSIVKQPNPFQPMVYNLAPDGQGLINLLFQWHSSNGIPQRIEYALKELFPGWQMIFEITSDGRIAMKVKVGNVTFNPPSLPDGFYRLLVILAAIELRPKLLIIDEIENSLHLKILQYLMDTFKTCESTIVLTTHSPLIVDLVQPEDLIIFNREDFETQIRRVKDAKEIRKMLVKLNVSLSESWLSENL